MISRPPWRDALEFGAHLADYQPQDDVRTLIDPGHLARDPRLDVAGDQLNDLMTEAMSQYERRTRQILMAECQRLAELIEEISPGSMEHYHRYATTLDSEDDD